jgi:hypothetical protein
MNASEISETKGINPWNKSLKPNSIELIDIESNHRSHQNLLSKDTNKLFFTETSGKPYLTPRYACAIESAVKNTDLSGHIIVVMTAPFIDITFNNATYHLYTKHSGINVFFRFVNLDTIFDGTPIHQLHLDGHLRHHEDVHTYVQYR